MLYLHEMQEGEVDGLAMTKEARMCVESCREWYQAFSNFGKGEERSVKELLAVANIIESLSAQLDQVTRERDAAIRQQLEADKNNPFACNFCKHDEVCDGRLLACGDCDMDCPCNTCIDHDKWQWRGVEVE